MDSSTSRKFAACGSVTARPVPPSAARQFQRLAGRDAVDSCLRVHGHESLGYQEHPSRMPGESAESHRSRQCASDLQPCLHRVQRQLEPSLTADPRERRKRMAEFKDAVARLQVKDVRFLAGEHDASLDQGRAFHEFFGPSQYTFDHKGVHFIALDNVSDPAARIGDEQLAWLAALESGLGCAVVDRMAAGVVLTRNGTGFFASWRWRSTSCWPART